MPLDALQGYENDELYLGLAGIASEIRNNPGGWCKFHRVHPKTGQHCALGYIDSNFDVDIYDEWSNLDEIQIGVIADVDAGNAVRKVLDSVLKPKWRKKGATETHQSLLQLATDRNGVMRIVTTNFDHIFERAAKKNKIKLTSYAAQHPLIPTPAR